MKIAQVKIRGRNYDVHVDSCGKFTAEIEKDVQLNDLTLEGLKAKITHATRPQANKINIPFFRWRNGKVAAGAVTGIHASNKHMLVRWEGEKGVEQEYSWGSSDKGKYMRLNQGEIVVYKELMESMNSLQAKIEKFEQTHWFDMKKELNKKEAEGAV